MTEEELFEQIVRVAERPSNGIQPPFAAHGIPLHPDEPVDYEVVRSNFYSSLIGVSDYIFHPPLGAPHIDVERYPPTRNREFWCYVTNGMSDFPQLLPNGEPFRCELMACTRVERPGVPEYLRTLGEYPFDEGTFLSANHTVPMPPTVVAGGLPYVLLVPPFLVPEASSFDLNGNTVFTVMLIGITAAERQTAVDRSSDYLVGYLDDVLNTWLLDGRENEGRRET